MSCRQGWVCWIRIMVYMVASVGICACGFCLAVIIFFGPTIGPRGFEELKENLAQLDSAKAQWALSQGIEQSGNVTVEDVAPYLKGGRAPKSAFRATYHLGPIQKPAVAVINRRVEYYSNGHTPEYGVFPRGTVFSLSDRHLVWSVPGESTDQEK